MGTYNKIVNEALTFQYVTDCPRIAVYKNGLGEMFEVIFADKSRKEVIYIYPLKEVSDEKNS